MDVVPKRLWTTFALVAISIVSLIMIFSGSLDGAAAWANIIALPVAILGVFLTLRGSGDEQPDRSAKDRNSSSGAPPPEPVGHGVTQIGFAGRDQINVARDYYGQNPNGR